MKKKTVVALSVLTTILGVLILGVAVTAGPSVFFLMAQAIGIVIFGSMMTVVASIAIFYVLMRMGRIEVET